MEWENAQHGIKILETRPISGKEMLTDREGKPEAERLLEIAQADPEVPRGILFGGATRGERPDASDIDMHLALHLGEADRMASPERGFSTPPWTLTRRYSSFFPFTSAGGYSRRAGFCSAGTRWRSMSWPSAPPRLSRTSSTSTTDILMRSPMLDRERILAKIYELDGWELQQILPAGFIKDQLRRPHSR